MNRTIFSVVLLSLTLLSATAQAARFTNQFVEFELPNIKWKCDLEGAEWVCQSSEDQKKRDAIIILAAKLKNEKDTLDKYQEYLSHPKQGASPSGKAFNSQPKYNKVTELNSHPWVDSLHLDSEISGFYTRYLATVKEDIAVLVTYSITKEKYQDYLPEFDTMVKSMKVFRKQGGINSGTGQSIFQQAQLPGSFTQQNVFPDQMATDTKAKKPAKKEDDNSLLLIVLAGGAVAYIIWKRRQRR